MGLNPCLGALLEVAGKKALKIEVGELLLWISDLGLVVVQKFLQLLICKDESSIGLVLKTVCTNICGDLLGHIRPCHESACLLSKDCRKIVADLGGFYKSTWSTVSLVLVASSVHLIQDTHLPSNLLLDLSEITLELTHLRIQRLERLVERREQLWERIWSIS